MRLFVAVSLPDDVKEELARVQKLILDENITARCVKKDAMHLTLAFLGKTDDDQIDGIKDVLQSISFDSMDVSLSSLGVFPNEQNVRVIWIGLDSEESLVSLAAQIQDALAPFGYKPEQPYSTHLTLCRVKEVRDPIVLREKFKTISLNQISFTISSFELIQSTLTGVGPKYAVLAEFDHFKPQRL